jgi:nucleotide-binding universal stress UspA family protein
LSEEDPLAAILGTAVARECDLIVMGSHGRHGLRRLVQGSVTEQVIRAATCPVLVVKARAGTKSPSDLPATDSQAPAPVK